MENLIKALQIFLKYGNPDYPCHCEHDTLYVRVVDKEDDVSKEDLAKLSELGFDWDNEFEVFQSFRYGSF